MIWILVFICFISSNAMTFADLKPEYSNQKATYLSGTINPKVQAVLLNNGLEVAEILSGDNGDWSISNVSLVEGVNHFQVKESTLFNQAAPVDVALIVVDRKSPQINVKYSPDKLDPGGNLSLSIDTNEKLKSVQAHFSDQSIVSFTYNAWTLQWEAIWQAPVVLPTGFSTATIIATDLANNVTVVDTKPLWLISNKSKPVLGPIVAVREHSSASKYLPSTVAELSVPSEEEPVSQKLEPIIENQLNKLNNSKSIEEVNSLLTLTSPKQNLITIADHLTFSGIAKNSNLVVINGKEYLTSPDGSFSTDLNLNIGKQTILVQAINLRENKLDIIKRKVLRLRSFSDTKYNWANSAIDAIATLGLLPFSFQDDLFHPDMPITRGQFISALIKAKGIPISKTVDRQSFRDIPINHEYASVIEIALQSGLISLSSDNLFKPDSNISRADAVATLLRYSFENLDEPLVSASSDFNKEHWSAPYFLAGKKLGLVPLAWTNDIEYLPSKELSRAEAAYMLVQVPEIKSKISALYSFDEKPIVVPKVQLKPKVTEPVKVTPPSKPAVKRKPIVFPKYIDLDSYPPELQQKIGSLSALGYISGDEKKRFNPDSTMTRAELSALIVQSKKLILPSRKDNIAADVDYKYWANRQIQAVLEKGYLGVDYNNYFDPEGPVSRALVVVTLAKVMDNPVTQMPSTPDSDALRSYIVEVLYDQPQIKADIEQLLN